MVMLRWCKPCVVYWSRFGALFVVVGFVGYRRCTDAVHAERFVKPVYEPLSSGFLHSGDMAGESDVLRHDSSNSNLSKAPLTTEMDGPSPDR